MVVEIVLYGFLAIVVAAALFALATRFLPAGEQIAPPLRDEPVWNLPAERSLHPEDVDTVRLPVALRGYRFAETDVLLDRLVHELRVRDAEIARLRAPHQGPSPRPDTRAEGGPDSAYARPVPEAVTPAAEPASESVPEPPSEQYDDAGYAPLSFAKADGSTPPPYAEPADPSDPTVEQGADRATDPATDPDGRRRDDSGA